ncbi:hypothetical protein QFZ32_009072 [Streptomyces canus]|nr:hypothetical protein [Streptomyces canus]
MPPAHHAFGEGIQQQVAQIGAVDLGSIERGVVGCVLLEQQGAIRLEKTHVLTFTTGNRVEPVDQTGLAQRPLTGVDVEHAALTARPARRFTFVHDGADAVHVQDPGESQAAEAGSDDGDGHGYLLDTLYGSIHRIARGNVSSAACWCGRGQSHRIDPRQPH